MAELSPLERARQALESATGDPHTTTTGQAEVRAVAAAIEAAL